MEMISLICSIVCLVLVVLVLVQVELLKQQMQNTFDTKMNE